MTWLEQWRNLAARIDGLIRAGEFLASAVNASETPGIPPNDNFDCVKDSILPERNAIIAEIKHLGDTYASDLPPQASVARRRYVTWGRIDSTTVGVIGIQSLAPLASFRSEFEYLIRDTEAEGRSLTELAFVHLQRQLEVDEDIRKKWQEAFKKRETACERLGAVHLLSHGIWAFKVSTIGSATDLVFNNPVDRYADIMSRTARALILTEWKLVRSGDTITTKAQEARTQARHYSGGVLGDVELKRIRYIVLVCHEDLNEDLTLPDVIDEPVTYRHVLLSMSSMAASVKTKKLMSRRKS